MNSKGVTGGGCINETGGLEGAPINFQREKGRLREVIKNSGDYSIVGGERLTRKPLPGGSGFSMRGEIENKATRILRGFGQGLYFLGSRTTKSSNGERGP